MEEQPDAADLGVKKPAVAACLDGFVEELHEAAACLENFVEKLSEVAASLIGLWVRGCAVCQASMGFQRNCPKELAWLKTEADFAPEVGNNYL